MGQVLERAIDRERGDAIAAGAAAMGEVPALREFVLKFRRGRDVRLTMSVHSTDSFSAIAENECLKEPGEVMDVQPRAWTLSEQHLLAADVERSVNKAARVNARNDRDALELQLQHMRCVGAL